MTRPKLIDSHGNELRVNPRNALASSFQAASLTHQDMMAWRPWNASGQSALTHERDIIAARVHDIARNDGWASASMDRQVDSVIGEGWRLVSRPNHRSLGISFEEAQELADGIEAEWKDFANDSDFYCTAERRFSMGGAQALGFRHRVMDGEALAVNLWLDRGGDYATCLQVIDPDRLSNPQNRPDTETMRAGVEMDENGAAIAYHFRAGHPGDDVIRGRSYRWERVERETDWGRRIVVHAFEPQRAGQVRGVPPLAPILKKLKQITRYDEVELQAATLNAVLAAFITSPYDSEAAAEAQAAGGEISGVDRSTVDMYNEGRLDFYREAPLRMPGVQIGMMYPGEQVTLTQPQHPNTGFEAFMRQGLRNVASAAGISYEQLTMDWSQVNYSSARAALLEIWRGFKARKGGFASQFMQPFFGAWLEEAIDNGRVRVPRGAPAFAERKQAYITAEWIGPGRGWIDPQKEADAAVTRIDGGFSTLARECAEQGEDWQDVLRQRKVEIDFAKSLGLDPAQALRPVGTRNIQGEPER